MEFMSRFSNGTPFGECLIAGMAESQIETKRGKYELEEARDLAKKAMDAITRMRTNYLEEDDTNEIKEVEDILNNLKCRLIKKGIMINIIKELN
jgi:hypothetical protein